ncbi:hypothetical protein HELRODRAFT_80858 [Helobdella robusta]|uniref:Suppressor of white apricot N-terminal domain-containing protein n=1 Tax=Helobdella robusta TaxID=6412 RepID=T1G463_HELRO|nr:hypothetical protein HELRODRAFT_80858 [Helobdella robusta]ESO03068.1 hypothetical protein HELRODRAFT_80858 [Helobdella robusta]
MSKKILRTLKEGPAEENYDDLLVFGYQCTLFRDDEKAMYIDQCRHLIPWMGDDTLLIDRYDGRGHLSDLSAYDSDIMKNRGWDALTEREKQMEEMIDQERYLDLFCDVEEKLLYEGMFRLVMYTTCIFFKVQ